MPYSYPSRTLAPLPAPASRLHPLLAAQSHLIAHQSMLIDRLLRVTAQLERELHAKRVSASSILKPSRSAPDIKRHVDILEAARDPRPPLPPLPPHPAIPPPPVPPQSPRRSRSWKREGGTTMWKVGEKVVGG